MFYGSIPALVTPFDKNHNIDYISLRNLLQMHMGQGSDAIVLGGTTGESPTLETQELFDLISFCKKELGAKLPLIVGTGSNSTKKTIALTARAKELGANAALVIVPYYNMPTDEGCLEHFRQTAQVGLPIIAYHHPGRTGKTMQVQSLVELLRIPGIVALKEASGSLETTKTILSQEPKANIFSGDDPLTLELIKIGACGSISIIANLYPSHWSEIVHAALKRQFAQAEDLYRDLDSIITKVLSRPNPIGIKKVMQEHNMCKHHVRLPLLAEQS
jgi:4-hydroxy-tetrahydrodipicolinate synthase